MAAPRKYSDAQRQELLRLHEAGLTSAAIAQACERGTAGTAPFTISRRTVSDIVARMTREAVVTVPTAPADASDLETVNRFPERIMRILDQEIDRLALKQRRGKLSTKDMEVLRKATEIVGPLSKRLRGEPLPTRRSPKGQPRDGRGAPRKESVLEKMAREQREQEDREASLSPTHTPPNESELTVERAGAAERNGHAPAVAAGAI